MSKNKSNQQSDAEDYLAQVEWHNQQSQRRIPLPWYMEPKWRYKRSSSAATHSDKFVGTAIIILTILIAGLMYLLLNYNLFLPIIILVMGGLIFLAVRDASKRPRDDN